MVNRFSELRSKEIIHVCEGTRLGYCNDLCIDTDPPGHGAHGPGPCRFLGLFGRDSDYIIPWCCIRRIGEDIILVEGSISSWRVMRKRRGRVLRRTGQKRAENRKNFEKSPCNRGGILV